MTTGQSVIIFWRLSADLLLQGVCRMLVHVKIVNVSTRLLGAYTAFELCPFLQKFKLQTSFS